jgi:hypothetical protein
MLTLSIVSSCTLGFVSTQFTYTHAFVPKIRIYGCGAYALLCRITIFRVAHHLVVALINTMLTKITVQHFTLGINQEGKVLNHTPARIPLLG